LLLFKFSLTIGLTILKNERRVLDCRSLERVGIHAGNLNKLSKSRPCSSRAIPASLPISATLSENVPEKMTSAFIPAAHVRAKGKTSILLVFASDLSIDAARRLLRS